jgi:L-rhamnose-H+ transport protein
MAVALGYTAAFGTMVPPLVRGELGGIVSSASGRVILLGVVMCLAGIAVSGLAGVAKERELPPAAKHSAVREFSFSKGMVVATFSGVMSACFAYGLAAGGPIADVARLRLLEWGRADLWQNLPVLVVVLLGGFTTNVIWCVGLNVRNRSGHEYVSGRPTRSAEHASTDPSYRVPLTRNYLLSALAGTTWYLQFFFYGMGQTRMGPYEFSSWTLHMASIIIFSTLWGVALHEWHGTSRRTHVLVAAGFAVLVGSTVVVGYGNYLAVSASPP